LLGDLFVATPRSFLSEVVRAPFFVGVGVLSLLPWQIRRNYPATQKINCFNQYPI